MIPLAARIVPAFSPQCADVATDKGYSMAHLLQSKSTTALQEVRNE
jgi:hypothetical protein